jgi:uncharacterized membrane-anchored protein
LVVEKKYQALITRMSVRLEDIERLHLGLLGGSVLLAAATAWLSPWSLLLGGAVMGLNFWLMRQMARRWMGAEQTRRPGVVVALLIGKFSLFLGLLALLFWRVALDPAAFGVGATLLLVACVAVALRNRPVGAV